MKPDVLEDLILAYSICCERIEPVQGGWLNAKWKVSGDSGVFLVKQYSRRRYSQDGIQRINEALKRQIRLCEQGVRCPRIVPCAGEPIRWIDREAPYVVMEFRDGEIGGRDRITLSQLRSLGDACGAMHRAFAGLPLEGVIGYPVGARRMIDGLWDNYHARLSAIAGDACTDYERAVRAMEPVLRDLSPSLLDAMPKGIAHEDFSPDNMLFLPERVSVILDFDRNQYGFPWHDVGRAMLSLALVDNRLDRARARAFLDGYVQHMPFEPGDLADALRVTWCIETPWWIQSAFFGQASEKVLRFKDEMLWLTRHWFDLDALGV